MDWKEERCAKFFSNSNFSDCAKNFERVSEPRCFDGDGDVGGDVEIDGVNQEDVKEGLVIFPKSFC